MVVTWMCIPQCLELVTNHGYCMLPSMVSSRGFIQPRNGGYHPTLPGASLVRKYSKLLPQGEEHAIRRCLAGTTPGVVELWTTRLALEALGDQSSESSYQLCGCEASQLQGLLSCFWFR